jgi:SAM-dependent methyltransferase
LIDYLDPRCRPSNLDGYGNVSLLLAAVRRALPHFRGKVLDVGCGTMPYKSLIVSQAAVTELVGVDLPTDSYTPDIEWDGVTLPLPDNSVDSAMMTEVLEHCPDAGAVLKEVSRVLRPGGFIFLTVPFIWPMHDVPYDEFRYTAFSLRRLMVDAGFAQPQIEGTGGANAMLAVILGLWVRRRPISSRVHLVTRPLFSFLLWPLVWVLMRTDRRPTELGESTLIVGLSAMARKPFVS